MCCTALYAMLSDHRTHTLWVLKASVGREALLDTETAQALNPWVKFLALIVRLLPMLEALILASQEPRDVSG